ncbi:UNVERIFIED_CONTAM: hypothetical protein Sradi_5844500 [Sesamum radiatum]|uniref:CCHC-type domain-containing protein n=1 Tax=Sesamum radiatum TaxID=300843 RepID=A0AAW2KT36_SESRA
MEERLRRVEELVGKSEQPPTMGLIQHISIVNEMVENLKMKVKEELPQFIQKGLVSMSEEIDCLTDVVDIKLEALKTDLRLLKKVVASGGTEVSVVAPDPKPFGVEWSANELENFLFANWEHIETWEVLEKEFKDQFLPFSMSWVARESLRNLGHIGMRKNDSGESNVKFGKKFKKKEKAKEVVMETFKPRAVEKPMGGCFICGNLEHRARNCPKRNRLNAIVAKQKTMKALVDTGATTNFISDQVVQELGLDVKPYDSQVKAVNSKIVPVSGIANIELSVGGNKLTFVRVEYNGGTTTTKKFEMAEARPYACSSKEGAQSPRLADFSCIGKMPEEMDKRWTKVQQICGAKPEMFMCGREWECKVEHSDSVRDWKRALMQSTS